MPAGVPDFLYGTAWKEAATEACVTDALAAGFRGIDTANQRKHYFEAGVGVALQAKLASGELRRSDVFLQTKFTYVRGQDQRLPYDPEAPFAEQVEQSFESSLAHLGVGELDSLLLHGPEGARGLAPSDWEVWRAFERLHDAGRVRFIGVSNVSREQLALLLAKSRIPPAFVQNRCFARTGWDREVRALCRDHDVLYQGFSLLTANTRELRGRAVGRIAERLGRTPEEIVFAFALGVGMLPLTGSSSAEHLRRDLATLTLELGPDELQAVENAAKLE